MSDRHQYLLELAKRMVQPYIENPKTKAVMLTDSVAEELCDEYSDCEVCFYYDELPTDDELYQINLVLELARHPDAEFLGVDRQTATLESKFLDTKMGI